jgi:DNA-binding CsgD family transcriptional regulator
MELQSILLFVFISGVVYAVIQAFFYLLNRNKQLQDKLLSKNDNSLLAAAILAQAKNAPTEKKYVFNPLSKREMEIAVLLVEGLINKEIAETLSIATNTVNNHLENMKEKTNCHSKAELVAYLLRNEIVEL